MMDKQSLRRHYRSLRDNLPANIRDEKGRAACKLLLGLREYKQAQTIMTFLSFGAEISTAPIIESAISEGKNVAVPVVRNKIQMEFVRYGGEMKLSSLGVPEPVEGEIIFPDERTLVIVPGLMFGHDMYRVGYGGGYYDRYLSLQSANNPLLVGFCFSEQLADAVPHDHYDLPLDIIITDTETVQ